MAKTPMTIRGAELLRAELQRLKTVDRPSVITAIAEARAHGDLSENAEYDAARSQQGFIEGRISELEAKLGNAQIIKASVPLSEMFGYATDLRSMTQGRADFTMQFDRYEEVPQSIASEIIDARV